MTLRHISDASIFCINGIIEHSHTIKKAIKNEKAQSRMNKIVAIWAESVANNQTLH